MEKTIVIGGVQYVARRRTNINKVNINYYKGAISVCYQLLATELNEDTDDVATALLDYAQISGQVSGGAVLLKPTDNFGEIEVKCRGWLTNSDLVDLGDILTKVVNDLNTVQADKALAPDPLPDNADPKASSAVKPKRKRRATSG